LFCEENQACTTFMRYDDVFLNECRQKGDDTADALIANVFAEGTQANLFAMLKLERLALLAQPESAVKTFLLASTEKPTWFAVDRLHNGQRLFEAYALEMMTLLGAMALPYCYAASPGNKALYLSDKMRSMPGKRLMDTAAFVIAVLTPGNLTEKEIGVTHINRVRLIHALSRYYVQRHPEWKAEFGIPINQEDMAGTNLAFSYIILMGLIQSGFAISKQQKEDFTYAWRYIGYVMGINEDLLPSSFAEAAQLTYTIERRNFAKTEEGITLTSELLDYYKANVPGWRASLIESQIRLYVGNAVAEYIGLGSHPIRDRVASWMGDFQSLKNLLTIKTGTYGEMLMQHELFRKKVMLDR
jgi:hypothetical protein